MDERQYLVLTKTGGSVHGSQDGSKTLCGREVDPHRGTSFYGHTPDCLICRKHWKQES